LRPGEKTLREFVWIKPGEHPAKRIVRWNAMGQCQELLEPLNLGVTILFHVFPALGPADDSTQSNDENIEQRVTRISTPGITHLRKMVQQTS